MTLLFKKLTFFIIPFIPLIVLEVVIDPFNYFSEEKNPDLLDLKRNISLKKNAYLFKLIEYDRNPSSIIILGDSRADDLSAILFEDLAKEQVSNLGAGGGSLQDAIEIFGEISSRHKLKEVYFGIAISSYNGVLLKDRVTSSIKIKNSLPLYLLNRSTFESTFLICRSLIFNTQIDIEKPPFSREEFWEYQMDYANRSLGRYSYPQNYYKDLKRISDYCFENNIKLVFFIAPTHTDLQNKIVELGLTGEYEKFKTDIVSFGDVYDFSIPNILTSDKENFEDPYHCKDFFSDIVIREMVLGQPKYSYFTKCLRMKTEVNQNIQ